jgi:dipeptidyl aminopeptidase/acylaminoacyl peptidase
MNWAVAPEGLVFEFFRILANSASKAKRVLPLACAAICGFALLHFPPMACAHDHADSSSRAAAILDSMPRAKRISQVALSPDGTRVAYIANQKLTVAAADGSSSHEISVKANLPLRDIAWSSDSKRLAFIADLPGDAPSAQIWTASADGSALTQHAQLQGYLQTLRFSPDGSKLALLFAEGMPRVAGPLQPMTPLSGVVEAKIYEQRIATLDLASNQLNQLTPPDMYVYEYDWTPDGKAWVATAAPGVGDDNWYIAHLYLFNAQNGQMRDIYKPKLQLAYPRVSPDGQNVAFIEGLMSDEGSTGGDIHVVSIIGGAARDITPGIHSTPYALAWNSPTQITFAQNIDGDTSFATVNLDSSAVKNLWSAEETAAPAGELWMQSNPSPNEKPIVAIVRQSGNTPPEVWAGPIGNWKQLTTLNAGLKPAWGELKKVHWTNGSVRLQGWLMFPKNFDPAKKYPLIVTVHGGPSAACMSRWDDRSGPLAAMGYFNLCPNPRGSFGQGEAFTQANVKDFGGGDFRDIMAGVDAMIHQYPVDPNRLGIRGHSYGGYMTMWASTHTQRFAAAVAGAGLSDWLSYYGVNDLDQWMIPFFGASIYDDPAVYAKSDPIHFVKSVKTPTLILVGDRDGEVPMEQSVEWWHALETLHVPTKFVVYPNEGHAIAKRADARDYMLRTLEWFEEWFAKSPQPNSTSPTNTAQPNPNPTATTHSSSQ